MTSIPTPQRSALVLLCACVCAGCERVSPGAGPAIRDSSGIVIVENVRPAWQPGRGWRLSDAPLVSIGTAAGRPEEQLDRVMDALRLPDGRIVIANDGSGELRYFAGSGRFLGAVGGRGEGPGEFRSIARLWPARGDSVVAYDPLLSRITTFAGETLAGSRPLRPIPGGGSQPPEIVGRFSDGSLLARVVAPLPLGAGAGPRRDSAAYLRLGPGDTGATTVGRFSGDESFVVREGSGVSAYPPIFGRRTYVAVGGDLFYVGPSDAYRIDIYAADGRLTRSIRLRQPSDPVTRAHVDRYRRDYLEGVGEERPRLERILSLLPIPSTFPAHGRMLVDGGGNLWVAVYPRPGDDRQVWNVFDPTGRWLGPVVIPGRFRITAIGGGLVIGVGRDELEVERVLVYRLVR